MKLLSLSFFIASISFFIIGCTSNTLKISTDYKPVDYKQLKTYQWLPIKKGEGNISEAAYEKITVEINKTLKSKGFLLKEKIRPDFYISYSVTAVNEVDINKYNTYEGYSNEFSWQRGYGLQQLSHIH